MSKTILYFAAVSFARVSASQGEGDYAGGGNQRFNGLEMIPDAEPVNNARVERDNAYIAFLARLREIRFAQMAGRVAGRVDPRGADGAGGRRMLRKN